MASSAETENAIQISDVPPELREVLEVYLESSKYGGGDIVEFRFHDGERKAIATFKNAEVAERFLTSKQISIKGHTMPITMPSNQTVYVHNVPSDDEEILEIFLENSRRGGGAIDEYSFDKQTRRARVVFREEEVSKRLVERGFIDVNGHDLKVSGALNKYSNGSFDQNDDNDDSESTSSYFDDDMLSRMIFIEDVPSDMVDFLELHLESQKMGGGDIEEFTPKHHGVLVLFKDRKVAERLLDAAVVNFAQMCLQVVKPTSLHICDDSDDGESEDDESEVRRTVKVQGIPKELNEEILTIFLENTRHSGGGDIEKVTLDETSSSAIVIFERPEVAQSLLERGEVKYSKDTVLKIVPCSSESDEIPGSVVISRIPNKVTEDKLIMFLENAKRSGGGPVRNIKYSRDQGQAVVIFEDTRIAKDMIRKGELSFTDGSIFKIQRASSSANELCSATETRPLTASARSRVPRTIEVTGLIDKIKPDMLKLYFENTNKSCGGIVEDMEEFDDGSITVTFANSEDAASVARKQDHMLAKTPLHVQLLDSWPESTSCAIRVRGFSKGTTQESIGWFFENTKRSGGGPVANMFYDTVQNVAVITFENQADALRTANNRQLSLNGANLTATVLKPARPPPIIEDSTNTLKDTFVLKGLSDRIQLNTLKKFASDAAGVDVVDVTFSCTKPCTAMVKYKANADYDKLLSYLCRRPCQGRMLSICPVATPNCIQVFNISKIHKDHLQLYFENAKKSGGGDVKHVKTFSTYVVIEFQDPKVLTTVVGRQHVCDNEKLHVSIYYPELGVLPPDFDSSSPFKVDQPDVTVKCAPEIVGFICITKPLQQKIDNLMKMNNCSVRWPKTPGNNLKLHCTVSSSDPDAYLLVSSWSEKCRSLMDRELAALACRNVSVLHDIWQPLRDNAEKGRKYSTDELRVYWDNDNATVHIAGILEHVDRFGDELDKTKNNLEDELKKKKAHITENYKLKSHQAELVRRSDFVKNNKDADVKISMSGDTITLDGEASLVKSVKTKLLKFVSESISVSLANKSSAFIAVLRREVVRKRINDSLANKKLVASYSIRDDDIMVHAFNQKDADLAINVITGEVVERKISVDSNSRTCLQSTEWNKLCSDITMSPKPAKVEYDGSHIVIVALAEGIKVLESKVQDFLDRNTIETEFIPLTPGKVIVLQKSLSSSIDQIRVKLKDFSANVRIVQNPGECGCEISAACNGMTKVKEEVNNIVRQVLQKRHKVDQQSSVKHLQSTRGRSDMIAIENQNQVSILFAKDDVQSRRASYVSLGPPRQCTEVKLRNGKILRLVLGDITRHAVDVIVNAANSSLQHGSGVAGAISKVGGRDIDRECNIFVKKHGELASGKVFCSSPGNLPCKAVVHTVGPVWHDGSKGEADDLKKAVRGALDACRKYRSVALPALSCGIFGFPHDKAASIIVRETMNVLEKTDTSLSEADIISGDEKVLAEFHKMLIVQCSPDAVKVLRPLNAGSQDDEDDDDEEVEDDGNVENDGNDSDDDTGRDDSDDSDSGGGGDKNDGHSDDNEDDGYDSRNVPDNSKKTFTSTDSGHTFKTAEGITISLVKGSIGAQKVDVIFGTTGKKLDLGLGAVSKNIAMAAGQGLQDECKTKWPSGISTGQVVKTAGHRLACKAVYLGAVEKYDQGAGTSDKLMRQLMSSALGMATNDRMTSIAFPAIGTGHLQYPPSLVAKTMIDEVRQFSATSKSSSVTDVRFVVYDRDATTLDAFEKVFQGLANGQTMKSGSQKVTDDERSQTHAYGYPGSSNYRRHRGGTHHRGGGSGRGHHHSHRGGTQQRGDGEGRGSGRQARNLKCVVGDVEFQAKIGDVVTQTCDAIVNSTNEKLDLNLGALSKAIVRAGGQSIQQECNQLGGLRHGLAVTGAGKLPCQFIFHLAPRKRDTSSWKDVLKNAFAEAEKMKLKSLVMPPVGTGHGSSGDVREMASVIIEEVSIFASLKPAYLRSITVVVCEQDMMGDFVAAVEQAENEAQHPIKTFFGKLKDKVVKFFEDTGSSDDETESSKKGYVHKSRQRKHTKEVRVHKSKVSALVLHIYGMSYRQIDSAIQALDDVCKNSRKEKVLDNHHVQEYVKNMTPDQENKIRTLCKQNGINVTFNKTGKASIILEGDDDNVGSLVDEIYVLMLETKDKAVKQQEAELYAKQAVWQYYSGDKFVRFDKLTAGHLEKAYKERKPSSEWTDRGVKHKVTFRDMKYTISTGKSYSVRRYEPGKITLPALWAAMNKDDQFLAVSIKPGCDEYQRVEKSLMSSSGGMVKSIVKIERIQNPGLYRQYMTRKFEMDQKNGTKTANERRLWHGTAGTNVKNINARNFNRNYGGVHGLAIGNGVYFATSASYSIQGYSPADAAGLKYIYQARVLTGKATRGAAGLKEPPEGFDSVSDNPTSPSMFVVFYDPQTYPEYLITFK